MKNDDNLQKLFLIAETVLIIFVIFTSFRLKIMYDSAVSLVDVMKDDYFICQMELEKSKNQSIP